MKLPIVAMALALAGACSKGKRAEACKAEAKELTALLNAIDRDLPPFVQGDLELVTRADLPRRTSEWGPIVEVRAGEVQLLGVAVAGPEELEEKLRVERAMTAERRPPDDPGAFHLVIDARARWETVVWATDAALAAGYVHPAVAFARAPAAVPAPPRSKVDDELDRILEKAAPGDKAVEVARLTSKTIAGCPALGRAFGVVSTDGRDKAQMLIDAIEPALIECNCSLDLPALRSIMYRLLREEHPVTSLGVTLAADGRAIVHPAATPWRDVAATLAAGPPVRFAIAPSP